MKRERKPSSTDGPILDGGHRKPITRRDFLGRGFIAGAGMVALPTWMLSLGKPGRAASQVLDCGIGTGGSGKIPFIGIDLAGGANIAGSNALVGGIGGQLDFLDPSGYERLGIPANMLPNLVGQVNTEFGIAMHADSAFLRGMQLKTSLTTRANTNGTVICARSNNDTGNNPHNPIYGINKAGAAGDLIPLIGSVNSESGGNSMAPASMIDPTVRPTKIDKPSDATGLVDTGKLLTLLDPADADAVMLAVEQISDMKLQKMNEDQAIEDLVMCSYVQSSDLVKNFGDPSLLDPMLDPFVTTIFDAADLSDDKIIKTATIMKLVVGKTSPLASTTMAGAGTIEFGGYDYHNGTRSRGETRDFEAGVAMGAILEYAALVGQQVMIYVFSDGAVSSDGQIDTSAEGRNKPVWRSDNSSTAASMILVYDPAGRPLLTTPTSQQIGYYKSTGTVETAANRVANNVDLLAESVVLNYLALHDEVGMLSSVLPTHGLGTGTELDELIAFQPIR